MSVSNKIVQLEKDIKITKLVVHQGSQVSNGKVLLLYTEVSDGKDTAERLISTTCGIVKKVLHKEGDVVLKW
jgi:hypothetical protein